MPDASAAVLLSCLEAEARFSVTISHLQRRYGEAWLNRNRPRPVMMQKEWHRRSCKAPTVVCFRLGFIFTLLFLFPLNSPPLPTYYYTTCSKKENKRVQQHARRRDSGRAFTCRSRCFNENQSPCLYVYSCTIGEQKGRKKTES